MPTELQMRRGTTAEHAAFTGAAGEVTVDTDKKTVVIHDGIKTGGYPLAGATGSFTAQSGETITVVNGLITGIV